LLGLVLSPKLGLGLEWQENGIGTSVAVYQSRLNLRKNQSIKSGGRLDIDLQHTLQGKFKNDPYYGATEHLLQIMGDVWLKGTRGKIRTGLDIRSEKNKDFQINKQRLLPLIADFDFTFSKGLRLALEANYSFCGSYLKRFEAFSKFNRDTWQLELCGIFNKEAPDKERLSELRSSLDWHLLSQSPFQITCYYDLTGRKIKESRLTLNQDLHCWQGQFSVSQRLNPSASSGRLTEFQLGLSLK
jgi:hypothetical protein